MKRTSLLNVFTCVVLAFFLISCERESEFSIVGKWIHKDGKVVDFGGNKGDVITWEFKADGVQITNNDAVDTSTYIYNADTKLLQLWGGVQETTIVWYSETEFDSDFIGRYIKQ